LGLSIFVENISDEIHITNMVSPSATWGGDGGMITRPLIYGVTISYDF
jgi:hypothetical protein